MTDKHIVCEGLYTDQDNGIRHPCPIRDTCYRFMGKPPQEYTVWYSGPYDDEDETCSYHTERAPW